MAADSFSLRQWTERAGGVLRESDCVGPIPDLYRG